MLILLIPSIIFYQPIEGEYGDEPDPEDTDGDGLSDEEEEDLGTNYEMKDTDEDGIMTRSTNGKQIPHENPPMGIGTMMVWRSLDTVLWV